MTKLVAYAVNPDDMNWSEEVGRKIKLSPKSKEIPVIADYRIPLGEGLRMIFEDSEIAKEHGLSAL